MRASQFYFFVLLKSCDVISFSFAIYCIAAENNLIRNEIILFPPHRYCLSSPLFIIFFVPQNLQLQTLN